MAEFAAIPMGTPALTSSPAFYFGTTVPRLLLLLGSLTTKEAPSYLPTLTYTNLPWLFPALCQDCEMITMWYTTKK